MRKLVTIALLLSITSAAQIAPAFTQYMFNGILFNPAYAGNQDALNVITNYRRQWAGMNGAPTTLSFGAHSPLANRHLAVGVTIQNDRFALYERNTAQLIYAYRFTLGKGRLSLAVGGGAEKTNADWSRIVTHDAGDPVFTPPPPGKLRPAVSTGIYYQCSSWYAGVSVPRLIRDANGSRGVNANAGFIIPVSDNFSMRPAAMLRLQQNVPMSANVTLFAYFGDHIGLGAGFSYRAGPLFCADIRLNDQLRFGYGYERTGVLNGTVAVNSHEVMLRYTFRYRLNTTNARYF